MLGNLSDNDLRNLKELGRGACRKVWAFSDDLVVKKDHAKYKNKYYYNENEYVFWNCVKGTPLERFFFEVVEFCPERGFLLMRRAHKFYDDYDKLREAPGYDKLIEVVRKIGLHDYGTTNCAIKDGQIAMIDYGFQHKIPAEKITEIVKELKLA